MLKRTYDKIYQLFERSGGYLPSRVMISHGVSTIHIKELMESGDIEKISHGNYWGTFLKKEKPENFKMVEACMTNPHSVICGPSACFFHGLLKKEPDKLYVATSRSDRAGMKLRFPVSRHYYSDTLFEKEIVSFKSEATTVRVYDIDRSVVDCIRMVDKIGEPMLEQIIKAYKRNIHKDLKKCYRYADKMRVGQIVRARME